MSIEMQQKLAKLERERNIHILYACEAGSRAYGLASPDSDFDIRFIYLHPKEWYLSLDTNRDVIELPATDSIEISGWELTKALRLLRKSNPSLLEWLQAEKVYQQQGYFTARLKEIQQQAFNPRACYYHYMQMAKKNAQKSSSMEAKTTKMVLHILRPLLACQWIKQKQTFPPNHFSLLVGELVEKEELTQKLTDLMAAKRSGASLYQENSTINKFIEQQLQTIEQSASSIPGGPENERDLTLALDELFREMLHANGTK